MKFANILFALTCMTLTGCSTISRKLLFYPTHSTVTNGLAEWRETGGLIGFSRVAENPEAIWLFVHGNGGQATNRVYALPAFSPKDSVYILEYPGYGSRPGTPSKDSFDEAVFEAYRSLRSMYKDKPICVAAESIGSGPAAMLARGAIPPDKFVFVVPFDTLQKVASDHLPLFPVGLILGRTWDNVAALQLYQGPIDIFAARNDTVIPLRHASNLARSLPQARFIVIDGGHNDWSSQNAVHFTWSSEQKKNPNQR